MCYTRETKIPIHVLHMVKSLSGICVTHEKIFVHLDVLHMNTPIMSVYFAARTYVTLVKLITYFVLSLM